MSTSPRDEWSSDQQWDLGSDPTPYGQPFDPAVSSPQQQPPPPGWEQGTWTHHAGPVPAEGDGRWLLVGIGVLVVVIIIAAVIIMAA